MPKLNSVVPPNLRRCQDRRLFCRNNAAPRPAYLTGSSRVAWGVQYRRAFQLKARSLGGCAHIPGPVIAKFALSVLGRRSLAASCTA